jgi:hypothetical protein
MTFPFKSISTVITEDHPDANDGSVEGAESVLSNSGGTTTTDTVVLAPGLKKRFMLIDETKLPKEEAERLLVKRAYNRECAERARKRSKETVKELYRQVEELQADKTELRRTLATMEKEIRMLKDKNKALTLNRFAQGADMYSHHNLGMSSETVSPLHLYSSPSPFSALSMLQQSGCGEGIQQNIGSLLPSWDYNKLLFLQQIRK